MGDSLLKTGGHSSPVIEGPQGLPHLHQIHQAKSEDHEQRVETPAMSVRSHSPGTASSMPTFTPYTGRNSRLGLVWSVFIISVMLCSGYLFRDYIQMLLAYVEHQNDLIVFLMLVFLYGLVSLPFAWGYLIINIATGYMYGFVRGLLVTMVTATCGILIADLLIKTCMVTFVKR